MTPHLDGDAEARDKAEEHQAMEGREKNLSIFMQESTQRTSDDLVARMAAGDV